MAVTGKKIGIMVYLDPETYRQIEESRNPRISKSCFCSLALEEVFRINRPQ